MKAFIVFTTLCSLALADDYCYKDVNKACDATKKPPNFAINCTAKYGAIDVVEKGLQKYVNHHLVRSFDYLLMSTHFANYQKNRPGFEKVFRELSDETWKDAIELIQYITKRGGEMNFNLVHKDLLAEEPNFELFELSAIAKALDTHKKLAVEAHSIHSEASRKTTEYHDPEIASHLEQEFMHKHRDIIRKLAGYTTDLSSMLAGSDSSLSLYLFDEYLQKE